MAKDINQVAFSVVTQATKEKNPSAVALGKLGGAKGGKARSAFMTPARREEIDQKDDHARWTKKN